MTSPYSPVNSIDDDYNFASDLAQQEEEKYLQESEKRVDSPPKVKFPKAKEAAEPVQISAKERVAQKRRERKQRRRQERKKQKLANRENEINQQLQKKQKIKLNNKEKDDLFFVCKFYHTFNSL